MGSLIDVRHAAHRLRSRSRRARRRADEAVSTIAGFAVALAVYSVAFAAFMAWGSAPSLTHEAGTDLRSRADGGVASLLASEGSTQSGVPWYKDPDNVTRFGLAPPGNPDHLDLDKLRNLTRGNMTADPRNGLLDYGEAKAALGAGQDDFHLRTYPLLARMANGIPIQGVKVAYVGDWSMVQQNGSSSYLVKYTSSVTDMGSYVFVNVSITNNGTSDAVFQATFTLPQENTVVDTANTGLLAAGGGTQNVTLKIYKTASWSYGGNSRNISVAIKDSTKTVASFKVDVSGIDFTAGSSPYALAIVSPEKLTYKTNQFPKIDFDIIDGKGYQVRGVNVRVNYSYASNNSLIAYDLATTKSGDSNKWDAPKSAQGEYNVTVNTTGDYAFNSFDRIYVTDGDPGTFTPAPSYAYVESNASIAERAMLVDLVGGFKNTTYNVSGGDAYMDFSSVMNNDLADNLSANGQLLNYTALVVGSNVDQTAMTSGAAREAVRNFTYAGGLLVVLGSANQQVAWLDRLFSSSISTASGGIGQPDPTNPILHVPEELAYTTYPDNGVTWNFGSASDAAHFTHVVTRGGFTSTQDALAVSKPGNFGNGTIVLTGWELYNLTAPQDKVEAERVLYNFLMQTRGALFLDFGPPVPSYAEVASASRLATAPDPIVPSQQVAVRVVLYTFR